MEFQKIFPFLKQGELQKELLARSNQLQVPADQVLLKQEQVISDVPLLLNGLVKVSREGYDKEHFLYFIKAGETCALTLSSCLRKEKSQVRATTLETCEILLVPAAQVFGLTRKFPGWNQFVLEAFRDRFSEIMQVFDGLAFERTEEQIIRYLETRQQLKGDLIIRITHQQLAEDLATSRVVVSRTLKKMEEEGRLRLHRNFIEIM